MDMVTSYGHIIKLKLNHRFLNNFRPGHVPLTGLLIKICVLWKIHSSDLQTGIKWTNLAINHFSAQSKLFVGRFLLLLYFFPTFFL